MSPRSLFLLLWAGVLALAAVFEGADSGRPGDGLERALAAPRSGPAAAPDNSIALQPFISSGLTQPLYITHAGDGTGRLFVLEKGGTVRLIVNGALQATPYLTLTVDDAGERGLLSMAFHPSFETNGLFYVLYTAAAPSTGNIRISEHQVNGDPTSSLSSAPTARSPLVDLVHGAPVHNGGTLAFGPDGKLYATLGDNAVGANAQSLGNFFGKVVRLAVNAPGALTPEIVAIGLRNPWRASFDRQTGDMYVGDVGEGSWEEINLLPAGVGGQNFGWSVREGGACHPPGGCNPAPYVDPILEYASDTPDCAVSGGYRYRGSANPALIGQYFYGDLCSGLIRKGIQTGSAWSFVEALDTSLSIVSFGEDEAGELYVVDINGSISRIVQTAPLPTATPTVTLTPPTSACAPRPRVILQTVQTGPGTLEVTVRASESGPGFPNDLQSLAFGRIDNAQVAVGGQPGSRSSFTVPLPNGTQATTFTVRRDQAGQPMHVDLTVVDRCGPWPTFVGAGAGLP